MQTFSFSVERFEYTPAELLLRLSLRLCDLQAETPCSQLLIECASGAHHFAPLVSCAPRAALTPERVWRGAFPVPVEVASDPRALFSLELSDELLLLLPRPVLLGIDGLPVADASGADEVIARSWPYALKRGAVLVAVTCQLSLLPVSSPAGALASGAGLSGMPSGSSVEAPEASGAEGAPPGEERTPNSPGSPEGAPEGSQPPRTEGPESTPEAPAPKPEQVPAPGSPEPGQTAPSPQPGETGAAPAATSLTTTNSAPTPRSGMSAYGPAQGPAGKPHARGGARVRGDGGASSPAAHAHAHGLHGGRHQAGKRSTHKHADKRETATAQAPGLGEASPAEAGALPAGLSQFLASLENAGEAGPPAFLIPIYERAGRRYHVPWHVLAAINQVETDYGRDLSVSSAGATGWMQFMPETWRQWAVDADRDGVLNPYSPEDAIFTAARYLQASGAEHDLPGAIFAYNHADWYVTEVLLRARALGTDPSFARIRDGYALPLDARYMSELGRTDDGVDIETAPDGALVYSMTPGIVTAVASDPGGFGPNYPVVRATAGSLQGQSIYYGHVAASLVHAGEVLAAGQPIAIIGHRGDAASLGHGHIEIGFSDAGGDPLSHHGAGAWTPTGDLMRAFLVGLSSSFGVHNE